MTFGSGIQCSANWAKQSVPHRHSLHRGLLIFQGQEKWRRKTTDTHTGNSGDIKISFYGLCTNIIAYFQGQNLLFFKIWTNPVPPLLKILSAVSRCSKHASNTSKRKLGVIHLSLQIKHTWLLNLTRIWPLGVGILIALSTHTLKLVVSLRKFVHGQEMLDMVRFL